MVAALAAVSVAVVAAPAQASFPDDGMFLDRQTLRCLDSNSSGDTYTLPCQKGNRNQRWVPVDFGTVNGQNTRILRNIATGLCLNDWAGSDHLPHTSTCNDPYYQVYYNLSGPNNAYLRLESVEDLVCLDSNDAGAVYLLGCNGGNYQNWVYGEWG